MGQEVILEHTINRLKEFWNKQNITSQGNVPEQIEEWENKHKIQMPADFKKLYLNANGMEALYPSRTDKEGFLFYPLQKIIDFQSEFNEKAFPSTGDLKEKCFIFMNYLHKSWWYGILFSSSKPTEYSIVIIPDESRYKVLTGSLPEFIDWYYPSMTVIDGFLF